MKLDNYKNIKKSEWQQIAAQFGIKYEENSVVRYLVEKIAEKIGVDDKIVSDNELKKKVVDKINFDYEFVPIEEAIEDVDSEKEEIVEEVSELVEEVSKIESVDSEKEEIVEEVSELVEEVSKIESVDSEKEEVVEEISELVL